MTDMDIRDFTVAILPIALSPGASFAMAVNNAARDGFRGVVPVIAGTAAGIYTHAILAGLGVTRLVAESPSAMGALKICGTIVLFWLSLRMIRSGLSTTAPNDASGANAVGVREAIAANLLNAKPILLYLTVVPLFAGSDLAAYFLAASIHVSIMAAMLSTCAVFLTTATRNAKSGIFGAVFNLVRGGSLLALTLGSLW